MLGLCSMNIAKNHWVTFKCTVIVISLHLLVPMTYSFGTIFTAFLLQPDNSFEPATYRSTLEGRSTSKTTDFLPWRAEVCQKCLFSPTRTSDEQPDSEM